MNDAATRGNYAMFARTNRREWGKFGFKAISTRVHALDKRLVLADIEVIRWTRALAMVKEGDPEQCDFIASRNANKQPDAIDLDPDTYKLTGKLENEVRGILYRARHFLRERKRYSDMSIADPNDVTYAAGFVAANNLAAALVDYAHAKIAHKSPNLGDSGDSDV